MMENGNNWLYCQIKGIVKYACGPSGQKEDLEALRNLVLELRQASDRIQREIERRMDAGKYAAESRWS